MRLFISDLHLEDPQSSRFLTFSRVMARESARCEAIYILGDLTEVWVGDDDDGPLATSLIDVLRHAAARCEVSLLHGNRDFLMGPALAAATGIVLIDEPHLLADHTLLCHGDGFCIDDAAYQEVRRQFRSAAWQKDILGQPLAVRRALAASLRAQSRAANANKAENIMDVAGREVDRVAAEYGARRIIHGHTHRPGTHTHSWGTRVVLGAWERCGWLARQRASGTEPALECFPVG